MAQLLRGVLLACLLSAPLRAQETPNVVLIIADDQAWGDYGFMGHPVVNTPSLDRLAQDSMVFEYGYVPSSLCRPSLATLATGLFPHQHGITGNDPPQGADRGRMLARIDALETLPDMLAERGYRSLQTGKWWEGGFERGGFTTGMTHGDPARGGRHGDAGLTIGRETMAPIFEFVESCQEAGEPFFVWYAPFLPHRPHNPPQRLLRKYANPGRSQHVARYLACIEWFDETCGALLDHLDARGLTDDTLVLLVSDNGWIQKEDGSGYAERSKRSPYEGGVRTPILVRRPGHVPPGRYRTPVSSVDIVPTVLAACGAEVPARLPGVDLTRLARGDGPSRGSVFGSTFEHDVVSLSDPALGVTARFVVEGRRKLILPRSGAPELYDVVSDPYERVDLAARPRCAAEVVRMEEAVNSWWPARTKKRPSFLFVLTDDQRFDQMGCAGHRVLQTPNIDRLAREGVRFTDAFVTTSICAASRASFLTSLYESAHGFTFKTPPISAANARRSFPALLRGAGYRTGYTGKWGVRVADGARSDLYDMFKPVSPPYDKRLADGTRRHATDLTTDLAVSFLEAQEPGEPFCLTVAFNAPHAEDGDPRQYIWPAALDGLYADVEVAPPPLAEPERFAALPAFLRESISRKRWGWRFDTEEKRVEMTRGYWRMVTAVDRSLGRMLDVLDEQGLADETIVVFTSDNGYFLGERGFAGKWYIYERSIRVPLIVFDPRAGEERRGVTAGAMALNVDIAPTLLDAAGVPIPAAYQGRSLGPLLRGERPDWRSDFLYEHRFDHPEIPKSEGVRGERWVYVRYYEQEPVYEELFDLAADPDQTRNLAQDRGHLAELERMRSRCDELKANLTRAR